MPELRGTDRYQEIKYLTFVIFTAGMTGTGSSHDPSRYRALIREAKAGRGRQPDELLDDARHLNDPYYVSLALFGLSKDPRLDLEEAASAAREALATAGRVESLWRRAELLSIIARKLNSWRGGRGGEGARFREKLLDCVLEGIVSMPEGQGLSDAVRGCTRHLGCGRLGPLLKKAASNRGFESADAKVVIRQWAQRCRGTGLTLEEIMSALRSVETRAARSRLLGYLHLQCRKTGCKSVHSTVPHAPLLAAVEVAVSLNGEERPDALRYLAEHASTREELEIVAGALDRLDDLADRARLMAALGTGADRNGLKEMALRWFREGLDLCSEVDDPRRRSTIRRIRQNLAKGLERCSRIRPAEKPSSRSAQDMDILDIKEASGREGLGQEAVAGQPGNAVNGTGNNILALYNTYEGGLKPVHLRAVARAAPLCIAFDMDLALINFPASDMEGLLRQVVTETGIGRGGKYLKGLMEQGRIVLVAGTRRTGTGYRAVEDWKYPGLPVATTPHPQKDKKIEMADAIRLATSPPTSGRHFRSVCLIMGLGKRGLPQSLLDTVPYHLELTGSNVHLETCTAMGVIAQQVRTAREQGKRTGQENERGKRSGN